jgi:hypothetical protein
MNLNIMGAYGRKIGTCRELLDHKMNTTDQRINDLFFNPEILGIRGLIR